MDNHSTETQGEEKKKERKEATRGLTRRNKRTQKEPMDLEGGGSAGVGSTSPHVPLLC